MNTPQKPEYKRYILIVSIGLLIALLTVISVNIKGLYFDTILGYQAMYEYQTAKIQSSNHVETVFIGDSSLGSAINAEYFSRLSKMHTLNLSLNGSFGFAGSYNMIKKIATEHKTLRNVVLMQTIDMFGRPVAYDGYLNSISGIDDLMELDYSERSLVLQAFVDSVISFDMFKRIVKIYLSDTPPHFNFQNDYMKQQDKRKDPLKYIGRKYTYINEDKIRFLKDINLYCKQNGLNLIYIHGPSLRIIKENSRDYIKNVEEFVSKHDISILEDQIYIEPEHIGDTSDHVYPDFKNLYTEKYFEILKNYLK